MTAQPELTTRDIETGIRTELATIRRYWDHTFDPPQSTGTGTPGPAASRVPGNDTAISLRAEVTRDLAFWVHALLDVRPKELGHGVWVRERDQHRRRYTEGETIDCTDVPTMARFLTEQAQWISGWEHGNRLWAELVTLAAEVRALASPRARDTIPLGECTCGTVVRAKAHDPGNIRCKGCGITDTIDGWTLRIVGHHELVTIPQLVPILHKRMGVVISERQLRRWHQAGRFAAAVDGPTPKFDRRDVFAALAYLEHRLVTSA